MKIAVVGTGYVGLTTGTAFAEKGHDVVCMDVDEQKINNLNKGIIPIWEPGLTTLVRGNAKAGRLTFTTSIEEAMQSSQVMFIAVGTPPGEDGSADLKYVRQVATDIGKALSAMRTRKNAYHVIVNKSTVPVGTGNLVRDIVAKHYKGEFDVVSNPEFLREGAAVEDCLNPDRAVVGTDSEKAQRVMKALFKPFDCPVVFMDVRSAELTKYASNALLASEISFINSISRVAEVVGADVTKVAEGMKLDRRIGPHAFLRAGAGYGGSCFPKDVKALIHISKQAGVDATFLQAVEDVNATQKASVVDKLETLLGKKSLKGKTVTVWGLAFKPNTDDMREAVALTVIPKLVRKGAKVIAHDPVADVQASIYMPEQKGKLQYVQDKWEAAKGADALVVLTEWPEYQKVTLAELKKVLKTPILVDGRNIWDPKQAQELKFDYDSIGRQVGNESEDVLAACCSAPEMHAAL